jgi:hypothetical protein
LSKHIEFSFRDNSRLFQKNAYGHIVFKNPPMKLRMLEIQLMLYLLRVTSEFAKGYANICIPIGFYKRVSQLNKTVSMITPDK